MKRLRITIIRPNNTALHQRSRVNQVKHMKRIFNYLTPITPMFFSQSMSFRLQLCSLASTGLAYLALSSTAALGQETPETASVIEDGTKQVETTTAIDGTNPAVDQESLIGPRALSRAFRNAAKLATPAVVTILSYGQQDPSGGQPQESADGEGAGSNNEQDLTGVGS
ncbi:MAG: hypothetical protein VX694_04320, partial [Planctomycetota bacterium]|nr:hypothetical protein [Planctomycetota bacterium]